MRINSRDRPWWVKQKWFVDSVGPIVAALGGAVSAELVRRQLRIANDRMVSSDGGELSYLGVYVGWFVSFCLVVLAVWKLIAARFEHKSQEAAESPDPLYWLCRMLHRTLPASTDHRVRITIHRVVTSKKKRPESLEQIIPYACCEGDSGGDAGRIFSAHCGIIGKACRVGRPRIGHREAVDHDGFLNEMVDEWGYTREQARELDHTRCAWMAVPLFDRKDRVTGVVFLDSMNKNYFSDEVKSIILSSVQEMNLFIREKYK